eukprot:2066965-Pyramimonas_sp.AAC.1
MTDEDETTIDEVRQEGEKGKARSNMSSTSSMSCMQVPEDEPLEDEDLQEKPLRAELSRVSETQPLVVETDTDFLGFPLDEGAMPSPRGE